MNQVPLKSNVQSRGFADDLFGFARFPDAIRHVSQFPIRGAQTEFVPELDKGYVFRKELLHVMQIWLAGQEKNLLLQGPTSSGKTTLIEQVAARTGWETFVIGCHGGLEFQELVGRVTLKPDGSTGWADGPLVAAMRRGGIFILDEMNFLKPEVAGGLNTILQATSYLIPETGEVVISHPDFRVAATGNAVDGDGRSGYRGVQTPNIALMTRFTIGARVAYMTVEAESAMLEAKAPKIHPEISKLIAEVAKASRLSYEQGELKAPMSPRETIATSKRLMAYAGNAEGDKAKAIQAKHIFDAMEMSMLFRWSAEDAQAFKKTVSNISSRLGIEVGDA